MKFYASSEKLSRDRARARTARRLSENDRAMAKENRGKAQIAVSKCLEEARSKK